MTNSWEAVEKTVYTYGRHGGGAKVQKVHKLATKLA